MICLYRNTYVLIYLDFFFYYFLLFFFFVILRFHSNFFFFFFFFPYSLLVIIFPTSIIELYINTTPFFFRNYK